MCIKIPEHEHETEDLFLWCKQRLVKLHTEKPHFCFPFILITHSRGNNESVYIICDVASDVSRLAASRFSPPVSCLDYLPLHLMKVSFHRLIAVHNLTNLTKHKSSLRRLPKDRRDNFYLTEELSNQCCLSFHFHYSSSGQCDIDFLYTVTFPCIDFRKIT